METYIDYGMEKRWVAKNSLEVNTLKGFRQKYNLSEDDLYCTVKNVADYFKMSKSTIYRYCKNHTLMSVNSSSGKCQRVYIDSILELARNFY